MFEETSVRTGMALKGYRPEVISSLLPFGWKQLQKMDQVDDLTFERFKDNGSPAFKEANTALKTLGRTNPTFAVNMAERYKKDPEGYAQMMDNLSKSMKRDPEFSQKIAEMAKKGDVKELTSLADAYQNDPGVAYARVMGTGQTTTVPPAAPSQEHQKPSGPAERKKTAAPSGTVKTGKKPTPAPAKPSDVPFRESLGSGEAPADEPKTEAPTGPLTADQAKERFQKMMQNPNNKLATEIRRNGVEGDILKKLEKNPNLVKNFGLSVNADEYRELLAQGKKAEFLSSFGGPDLSAEGMTQANTLGGLGDIGKAMGGIFEGLFSGGGPLSAFSGLFNQAKSLFSRIFGGGNIGILGTGKNLTEMLNNPNNPRQDPEYLNNYAKSLTANLSSSHPEIRRHAQEKLAEMGIKDRGQLHEIQQGRLEISHVGIEAIKGADGQMKNVPTAHVRKVESLEDLRRTPAANDPSARAPQQVAGSDVRADNPPVRSQPPLETRPPEPVPSVPGSGATGA